MKRIAVNLAILAAGLAALAVYATSGAGKFSAGAGLLAFGYAVGAYGTMVGAGGGFLIVPALLLVYHADAGRASGTSLAVVFLNAVSGTISYAQQKRVDYRAGLVFATACIPGAIIGAHVADRIKGPTFNVIFGIVLLCISALLLWRPVTDTVPESDATLEPRSWHFIRKLTDADGHTFAYQYNWLLGAVLSLFVGFLSSVLGIGGGIIHVPMLVFLLGFPPHLATATSHFILAITAGVGTLEHLRLGHVMPWPAILMGLGVIGGAQIGAVFGRKLKGSRLLKLLAVALICVAFRLLLS